MSRYIDADELIFIGLDNPDDDHLFEFVPKEFIDNAPTADVVEVVRCKDCKHRIVNEYYGEKGYMKLKAICDKDTGDPFELGRNAEDDEWFCADAERRTE